MQTASIPSRHGDCLVVTAKSDNVVQFLDVASFAVTTTLQMPASTHELALSPDGQRLFGSVYGGGIFGRNTDSDHRIVEIDLAERRVVQLHDVGGAQCHRAPHGLKFAPDGRLWITSERATHVIALEPVSGLVTSEVDVAAAPHWLDISQPTNRLFAANKTADFIGVVDLATEGMIGRIAMPALCEGITISPDGLRGFACAHTRPELTVFDTQTLAILARFEIRGPAGTARQLRRVVVSPDQRWVGVTAHVDGHFATFDYVTLQQQLSVNTPKAPMGMAFAADGRHLYLCCHDAAQLLEIDLADGRVTRTAETARGCEYVLHYA